MIGPFAQRLSFAIVRQLSPCVVAPEALRPRHASVKDCSTRLTRLDERAMIVFDMRLERRAADA